MDERKGCHVNGFMMVHGSVKSEDSMSMFCKRNFRPGNFVRATSAGEAPVQVFKTIQVFESC